MAKGNTGFRVRWDRIALAPVVGLTFAIFAIWALSLI